MVFICHIHQRVECRICGAAENMMQHRVARDQQLGMMAENQLDWEEAEHMRRLQGSQIQQQHQNFQAQQHQQAGHQRQLRDDQDFENRECQDQMAQQRRDQEQLEQIERQEEQRAQQRRCQEEADHRQRQEAQIAQQRRDQEEEDRREREQQEQMAQQRREDQNRRNQQYQAQMDEQRRMQDEANQRKRQQEEQMAFRRQLEDEQNHRDRQQQAHMAQERKMQEEQDRRNKEFEAQMAQRDADAAEARRQKVMESDRLRQQAEAATAANIASEKKRVQEQTRRAQQEMQDVADREARRIAQQSQKFENTRREREEYIEEQKRETDRIAQKAKYEAQRRAAEEARIHQENLLSERQMHANAQLQAQQLAAKKAALEQERLQEMEDLEAQRREHEEWIAEERRKAAEALDQQRHEAEKERDDQQRRQKILMQQRAEYDARRATKQQEEFDRKMKADSDRRRQEQLDEEWKLEQDRLKRVGLDKKNAEKLIQEQDQRRAAALQRKAKADQAHQADLDEMQKKTKEVEDARIRQAQEFQDTLKRQEAFNTEQRRRLAEATRQAIEERTIAYETAKARRIGQGSSTAPKPFVRPTSPVHYSDLALTNDTMSRDNLESIRVEARRKNEARRREQEEKDRARTFEKAREVSPNLSGPGRPAIPVREGLLPPSNLITLKTNDQAQHSQAVAKLKQALASKSNTNTPNYKPQSNKTERLLAIEKLKQARAAKQKVQNPQAKMPSIEPPNPTKKFPAASNTGTMVTTSSAHESEVEKIRREARLRNEQQIAEREKQDKKKAIDKLKYLVDQRTRPLNASPSTRKELPAQIPGTLVTTSPAPESEVEKIRREARLRNEQRVAEIENRDRQKAIDKLKALTAQKALPSNASPTRKELPAPPTTGTLVTTSPKHRSGIGRLKNENRIAEIEKQDRQNSIDKLKGLVALKSLPSALATTSSTPTGTLTTKCRHGANLSLCDVCCG